MSGPCFQWDYGQPYTPYLAVVSSVLNLFFMLEVVMKMVAFSARGYWQSRRNRYDLFVTALGLVWVILNFTFPMVRPPADVSGSVPFVGCATLFAVW